MGKGQSVTPYVLKYLDTHVGETVFLADMATALKFKPSQIQSVMTRMNADPQEDLEIVSRGQAWRYRGHYTEAEVPSTTANDPRLFDEIGVTRDGALIIQDVEGRLYRATEL